MAVVPVSGYALIANHYLYIPYLADCLLYGCMAGYLAQVACRRLPVREPAAEGREG